MARKYKTIGFSVPPMIAERIDEVVRERQSREANCSARCFASGKNRSALTRIRMRRF